MAAMAAGGALPLALASIHPRFKTPHTSTVFWAACVLLLALSNGFVWNAQLSAGARLVTYFSAALLVFCDRQRRRGWAILVAAGLSLAFCAVLVRQLERNQVWILVLVSVLAAGYRWLAALLQSKPSGMTA